MFRWCRQVIASDEFLDVGRETILCPLQPHFRLGQLDNDIIFRCSPKVVTFGSIVPRQFQTRFAVFLVCRVRNVPGISFVVCNGPVSRKMISHETAPRPSIIAVSGKSVNERIVCIAVLHELPLPLYEFGVGVIDIVIIIAADKSE